MSSTASRITMRDGALSIPDVPIIPYIEGDGTGADIWRASQYVFDGAVARAYGERRRIEWREVLAGEKSKAALDTYMP
ncbi:MAG: NADP-dependent isocitrate dehydrogenase, partial [Gemmatimonadaceae bacterium]